MYKVETIEEAMQVLDDYAGCEERQEQYGEDWHCLGNACSIYREIPSGDCDQVCAAAARLVTDKYYEKKPKPQASADLKQGRG